MATYIITYRFPLETTTYSFQSASDLNSLTAEILNDPIRRNEEKGFIAQNIWTCLDSHANHRPVDKTSVTCTVIIDGVPYPLSNDEINASLV